jgi:hypothetical protein
LINKNSVQKINILQKNKQPKDSLVIDESFDFAKFKREYSGQDIFISNNLLHIETPLFGNNKKSTKTIQQKSYKVITKTYGVLVKIIKYIKTKTQYTISNLYRLPCDRKNNNDYMLECMLDLKFNTPRSQRLEKQLEYACDYLDKELATNNICEFRDGKCRKYRDNPTEKSSCCKAGCKYGIPCKIKNISCKLFLCDTAINLGYFFHTKYIPMLRTHFSPIDRRLCETSLFLPMNTVTKIIKAARIISIAAIILLIFVTTIRWFI